MPLHDWTRVPTHAYHDFHGRWLYSLRDSLNGGVLPKGYYARAEQTMRTMGPDVLTLQTLPPNQTETPRSGARGDAGPLPGLNWTRANENASAPDRYPPYKRRPVDRDHRTDIAGEQSIKACRPLVRLEGGAGDIRGHSRSADRPDPAGSARSEWTSRTDLG